MLNQELVESAMKNKKYHIEVFSDLYPQEFVEDAFHNILIDTMTKEKNVPVEDFKKYVNVAMRNLIFQTLNSYKKFLISSTTVVNFDPDEGEKVHGFDKAISLEGVAARCYFNEIEEEEDLRYKLKEMHNHINNLHPKQRESVLAYLKGTGSTTNPNFKQAMRNLRDAMGGKIFKTNPDKYKPKSNRPGTKGALSREAVLDIRANVGYDKKGMLTRLGFYAEKYRVSKKVVALTAKRVNYKDIE